MPALSTTVRKVYREMIRMRTRAFLLHQRHFGRYAFIHINKCGGTSIERALGLPLIHDTAEQRIAKVGRARWDAMLTFSVVRHPYDRAVSHYYYRRKTGHGGGLHDGHIGLNDWILASYAEKDPRYYNNPLMFMPSIDWLTDPRGAMLVDRVLKLETISEDWPAFSHEAFGREIPLPHKNSSGPYAKNALGQEAKAALQRHFSRDFEAFGYNL